ncbi:hypothetical protein NQD34_013102 [Periophthalmus magnuspinnatus]|nr:hypothetical protein NQD34_013102 [Periophthalmus magnuspinnatus]
MATSNNPRKFSEKIALHNQKQAEETAAFEEVMKDLSITRQARLQKAQYLQLGPNRGPYYGGSLPNVNQIGNSATDGPFQTDSGRGTRHHGLVDRVYRERNRMTSLHRKPLSVDKHGRQISFSYGCHRAPVEMNSCPYGSVYLSPPPDTSWRRVNSDSALHQSTLTPAQQGPFNGGSQEIQPKRGITQQRHSHTGNDRKNILKMTFNLYASLTCPGLVSLSIFPSPEQQLSLSLKPAAHSTGGSLPDLTNLQFPPPLPTPLDSEDTGAGSYGSLHSLSTQQGNSTFPFLIRLLDNLFLIFVLGHPSFCVSFPRLEQSKVHGSFRFQQVVQVLKQQTSPNHDTTTTVFHCWHDVLFIKYSVPFTPDVTGCTQFLFHQSTEYFPKPFGIIEISFGKSETSLYVLFLSASCVFCQCQAFSQYRSRMGSSANQSPTSPVSNQGFSPGGSPQVRPGTTPLQTGLNWFSSIDNQSKPLYTGFVESKSLEQFNMFETPVSSDSLPYNQTSTLNYSQALMMGLSGPHLQDMQGLGFSNHGNIPNIILTVSGESPPGLNKDLGCLTTDLDLDSPFPLDDLRLDPLTLDGLHMLNDPDVILTDAATEDAFRMDRL